MWIDKIGSYCTTPKLDHIYKHNNLTYMELKAKSDSLAAKIIELFEKDKTPLPASSS